MPILHIRRLGLVLGILSVGLPAGSTSAMPVKKVEKAHRERRIKRIFRLPQRSVRRPPAKSETSDPIALRRRTGRTLRGVLRGSAQIRSGNRRPTTAHADVSFEIDGKGVITTKIDLSPRKAPYPDLYDLDPRWDGSPEPALAATFDGTIVHEYTDHEYTVLKVDYGDELTPLARRRLGQLGFDRSDFSKTRSTGEVLFQRSSGRATLNIETELVLKNQGTTKLGKGLRALRDVLIGRRVVITESYKIAETAD